MKKEMSNLYVMMRLITLVIPLVGWMMLAIILGVLGFLCAIFITVDATLIVAYGLGLQTGLSLSQLLILLAAFALNRGILRYGEQALNHYIAFKLLAVLRDKVFQKLRSLAPAKLEGEEKGNLISIITSDIELLEVFYAHTISPIVIALITSVLLLLLFYQLHPIFFVIAFLGYLYVGVRIPMWVSKNGKQFGDRYRKHSGELSSYTLESIRGLQEVMQYAQGEQRLQKMQEKADILHLEQKEMRTLEGKSIAKSNLAVQGFAMLILFCGLGLYQHGSLHFASILIGSVLMMSSFGPVIALSNLSNNLLLTLASGRRILTLLDEAPMVEEVVDGEDIACGNLHTKEITFSYEETKIFEAFSTTIQQGKITGILGKSGCGKSTLLKLWMRFWDVQKGSVNIHQTNISSISTTQLRSMQSFITQDTQIFHDTIENNIKIANMQAHHEDVVQACKQANLHDFIMELPDGYDTQVNELGESLSGGERQRLSLARAFLHDSTYIFLDEPTSNLDVLNESIILQSLRSLQNKTIVLVSHRSSTLHICDEILQLEEKRAS